MVVQTFCFGILIDKMFSRNVVRQATSLWGSFLLFVGASEKSSYDPSRCAYKLSCIKKTMGFAFINHSYEKFSS